MTENRDVLDVRQTLFANIPNYFMMLVIVIFWQQGLQFATDAETPEMQTIIVIVMVFALIKLMLGFVHVQFVYREVKGK